MLTLTSPKLRDLPEDQKYKGPRAEGALSKPYFVQKMLVICSQQITRSSVTIANLETITDMQSWCRI